MYIAINISHPDSKGVFYFNKKSIVCKPKYVNHNPEFEISQMLVQPFALMIQTTTST